MRVSCNIEDEGYKYFFPSLYDYDILIGGEPINMVFTADEELGFVGRYKTPFVYVEDEIEQEVLYGKVEIKTTKRNNLN